MNNNLLQKNQEKAGLYTERNVSFLEIKEIHQILINQEIAVSEEIIEAIERNDYVKLSHLLVNRSKIESAIKEIESLHEDKLNSHVSMTDRIGKALKDAAITMESKGEDMLLNIINNLDKLNEEAGNMVTRAILISNKTLCKGNQLNHRVGKLIIHKTSEGIAKLADIILKKS